MSSAAIRKRCTVYLTLRFLIVFRCIVYQIKLCFKIGLHHSTFYLNFLQTFLSIEYWEAKLWLSSKRTIVNSSVFLHNDYGLGSLFRRILLKSFSGVFFFNSVYKSVYLGEMENVRLCKISMYLYQNCFSNYPSRHFGERNFHRLRNQCKMRCRTADIPTQCITSQTSHIILLIFSLRQRKVCVVRMYFMWKLR